MDNNYKGFDFDLKNLADALQIGLDKVLRKVAFDVFSGVVGKTPVDTGALMASWVVAVNRKPPEIKAIVENGKLSKSVASSIAMNRASSELKNIKAGDVIYIANHMPYAVVAEYGLWNGPTEKVTAEGYSRKSPKGMVRITLEEVASKIEKVFDEALSW